VAAAMDSPYIGRSGERFGSQVELTILDARRGLVKAGSVLSLQ
jgi:hypothetical protein